MGTDVRPFSFPATGHEIRTVTVNGEPWLVAADVTAVLGYGGGARNAVSRLPDRMKGVADVNTPGGPQRMTVINEAGTYRLVMRSSTPDAEGFQDWLAEEVIPSIRQNGQYQPASQFEIPRTYPEALELAARQAREIEERDAALAVAAPKAQAWDTLASGEGDFSVADAAKILARDPAIQLGERRLFTLLTEWRWLFRQRVDQRPRVYQEQVTTGRLSELPSSHYHPRTGVLVVDAPQVRVTVKGLAELHRRLGGTDPLHMQPTLPIGV